MANDCGSGTTTWGAGSCSGDFALDFKPHGPVDAGAFTLGADGDLHQMMFLTSSAPVTTVPEPASLALFGAALVGLVLVGRRQRRRA